MDSLYYAPDAVAAHAKDRVPSLGAVQQIHRLSEGHMNFVWRVVGTGRSVIVKAMAPFAASDPSIPLDTRRAEVEASALEILSPGGALAHVGGGVVRVPRLLDHDRDPDVLILEDLGALADIETWASTDIDPSVSFRFGSQIGEFIGRVHRESTAASHIAPQLTNSLIQVTRRDTQYRAVEELTRNAGIADAMQLGRRALALGRDLCRPGSVFIMGDLWPRSLLVSTQHLAVIDWEFAHWGRPAQDVGHLVAHLWMLEHRADNLRLESTYERLGGMPPAKGRDEARHHWRTIYDAFPDFRMDAIDLTSEGDTLFAEISHGGTMEGPMGLNQPTGGSYRTQGAFRIDFLDGKMGSILSYWDTAAMMQQLRLAS